jgi:hypothetical protein
MRSGSGFFRKIRQEFVVYGEIHVVMEGNSLATMISGLKRCFFELL